jgi:hypothetical protein
MDHEELAVHVAALEDDVLVILTSLVDRIETLEQDLANVGEVLLRTPVTFDAYWDLVASVEAP